MRSEAEAALEQEAKVMRAQLEATQLRAEADRRVQEKEEEFDTTRKTHQRAIESLQALFYAFCRYSYVILVCRYSYSRDVRVRVFNIRINSFSNCRILIIRV